jgi:hypothetical protein
MSGFGKYCKLDKKSKYIDTELYPRNENGDIVYNIKLKKNEIYSPFATKENPIINESLVDHFDKVCESLNKNDDVEFVIHTPQNDKADPVRIEEALRKHYETKIRYNKIQSKRELNQGIGMFVVGFILYVIFACCKTFVWDSAWWELLNIFSWVFVWGAVDLIFIARTLLSLERQKYYKILKAKIKIVTEGNQTIIIQN